MFLSRSATNADMSSPIGTYKTGTDGKVKINKLKAGKVYVQETKVPDQFDH